MRKWIWNTTVFSEKLLYVLKNFCTSGNILVTPPFYLTSHTPWDEVLATALSIHLLKTGEGLLHACISSHFFIQPAPECLRDLLTSNHSMWWKINGDKKPREMEFLSRKNICMPWKRFRVDRASNWQNWKQHFRDARKRYRVHIVTVNQIIDWRFGRVSRIITIGKFTSLLGNSPHG
jgi:hypothetical protein